MVGPHCVCIFCNFASVYWIWLPQATFFALSNKGNGGNSALAA